MCPVCGNALNTGRKYCSQACYHEDETRISLAAFWDRVEKTPTCWIWKGQIRPDRYGTIAVHHVKRMAHRLSYELTHGPIPVGLRVLHTCDNPPCVNPVHLRLGTQGDNMADMKAKGRARSGSTLPNDGLPKLNPAGVRMIRAQYPAKSQRQLANELGVSIRAVQMVLYGVTWKNVA